MVAAQTGLYLVVIIAVAVLANAVAYGVDASWARWDVTKNERYTLSQGSARLVKNLNGNACPLAEMRAGKCTPPLQIVAYVTKGIAALDVFVADLTDLLQEYERAGEGKVQLKIVEANTDELRKEAEEEGLQAAAFGQDAAEGASEKIELAAGYMGIVLKYGSEKGVLPQLDHRRSDGLEFWITNKIREIRDKADEIKHRVGVITGKDELKLSDNNLVPRHGQGQSVSMKAVLQNALPFYTIEDVDLGDGANAIDKELDGLIITQPGKDYTDKELYRIDEFLMRGGKSLVVFASAVNVKPQDAQMQAELNLHNLDKLLDGYGLSVKKNAVFDFGASFQVAVIDQTGRPHGIRHPGIVEAVAEPMADEKERRLDTSFASFFRLEQVVFPYPSSVELLREKQPEGQFKELVRTTDGAVVVTDGSVNMNPLRNDWSDVQKSEAAQRLIAASVEGKLKSAFGGKEKDGVKPKPQADSPSRVLVVASSQFLTNPFAYSGNGPEMNPQFQMFGSVGGDRSLQMLGGEYARVYLTTTILSLKNTLDWMSGDTDLIAASAKLIGDPALAYKGLAKPKFDPNDDEETRRKKDAELRQARQRLQNTIQWTLTLGVPLLFAIIGILRWQWRVSQKNKKRI